MVDKEKAARIAELKEEREKLVERLASAMRQQRNEEARLALRGEAIPAGDSLTVKAVRREIAELDKQVRRIRSGPRVRSDS